MSVLITGVNMPSFGEGNELIVRVLPNGTVLDEHGIYLNAKAIPVPPHGRLIDADQFHKDNKEYWDRDFNYPQYEDTLADLVNAAPTIIPASEEGE